MRVHTARLRSRLTEYYSSVGAEDNIVVAIPKGGYSLSAAYRQATPIPARAPEDLELSEFHYSLRLPAEKVPPRDLRGRAPRRWGALLAMLVIAAAGIAFYGGSFVREQRVRARSAALEKFWRPFVAGENAPLVVFSNFQLVGSVEEGLRRVDGQAPEGTPVIDTYTTMGEVMGVFEIVRVMGTFQKQIQAKRGTLLTWDEAKDSNLIFVGGPLANDALAGHSDLPRFRVSGTAGRNTGRPWNGRESLPAGG